MWNPRKTRHANPSLREEKVPKADEGAGTRWKPFSLPRRRFAAAFDVCQWARGCPAGWTEPATAQGRYLVSLPSRSALAQSVGTALTDGENRPVGRHLHAFSDPGHSHTINYDRHGGNNGGPVDYAGPKAFGTPTSFTSTSNTTGISIQNSGTTAGTNAPHVELLVCQKQ